jgi:hypothetical protein
VKKILSSGKSVRSRFETGKKGLRFWSTGIFNPPAPKGKEKNAADWEIDWDLRVAILTAETQRRGESRVATVFFVFFAGSQAPAWEPANHVHVGWAQALSCPPFLISPRPGGHG